MRLENTGGAALVRTSISSNWAGATQPFQGLQLFIHEGAHKRKREQRNYHKIRELAQCRSCTSDVQHNFMLIEKQLREAIISISYKIRSRHARLENGSSGGKRP